MSRYYVMIKFIAVYSVEMFNYDPEGTNIHGAVAAATIPVCIRLSNFRFPSW